MIHNLNYFKSSPKLLSTLTPGTSTTPYKIVKNREVSYSSLKRPRKTTRDHFSMSRTELRAQAAVYLDLHSAALLSVVRTPAL